MINYETAKYLNEILNNNSRLYLDPIDHGEHITITINNKIKAHCYKNDTIVLELNRRTLDLPTLTHVNLLTPPDLVISKIDTRKFKLSNGHLLTDDTQIHIYKNKTWSTKNTYDPTSYNTQREAVHSKTRKLRRTLLPKLRLLGPEHFAEVPSSHRWRRDAQENIQTLIKIIKGDHSLPTLQMYYKLTSGYSENVALAFGRGGRYDWTTKQRDKSNTWDPNKIVDCILQNIRHYKTGILEALRDENKSRPTSQSKS